jgi:hypothetical protein
MISKDLLVTCAIAGIVACGGTAGDDTASQDGHLESAGDAPTTKWVGLYGTTSTFFNEAVNVTSESPLTFSISAARNNVKPKPTFDAHDLKATFDDASHSKATYKNGDCKIHLALSDTTLTVSHDGACTSMKLSSDVDLDGPLFEKPNDCWDVPSHDLLDKGKCAAAPGFPQAGGSSSTPAPSGTSDWAGLYVAESTFFDTVVNVKSENPFVFSVSAVRNNANDVPPFDAKNLQGQFEDDAHTKVVYQTSDCTIHLVKGDGSLAISHDDSCASLGLTDGVSLDAPLLFPQTDQCWDDTKHDFAALGTCGDF